MCVCVCTYIQREKERGGGGGGGEEEEEEEEEEGHLYLQYPRQLQRRTAGMQVLHNRSEQAGIAILNTRSIAAAHSNNNLSIETIPVHVEPRQFRALQRYTENYTVCDSLLILCAFTNSLNVVF